MSYQTEIDELREQLVQAKERIDVLEACLRDAEEYVGFMTDRENRAEEYLQSIADVLGAPDTCSVVTTASYVMNELERARDLAIKLARRITHEGRARESGLTYSAVRDLLTSYEREEISFSKFVEEIRSMARVFAERRERGMIPLQDRINRLALALCVRRGPCEFCLARDGDGCWSLTNGTSTDTLLLGYARIESQEELLDNVERWLTPTELEHD